MRMHVVQCTSQALIRRFHPEKLTTWPDELIASYLKFLAVRVDDHEQQRRRIIGGSHLTEQRAAGMI